MFHLCSTCAPYMWFYHTISHVKLMWFLMTLLFYMQVGAAIKTLLAQDSRSHSLPLFLVIKT